MLYKDCKVSINNGSQRKKRVFKVPDRVYSAPTCINLEITEACNFKCRHCYNPWRAESFGVNSLTNESLDLLIDDFVDCGVFHLVLSGGEPMAKFELLEYAVKQTIGKGLSVSVNSTLSLATPERIQRLRKAGLDHILTSWYDLDPEVTDKITATKNSHRKVVDGIKCAVDNGIRVSVNTICTDSNKDSIYESGKLVHSLGATQFIAHRVVPPAYDRADERQHRINQEISIKGLDELLRLKNDIGIKVGTLISYPLCLLGDLGKYADFAGRGCPTQSGHRFNINSTGDTHGCVMEDKSYGNVFEIGLREAFKRASEWRDKSYYYERCKGCNYIDVCQTGCRMDAFAVSGKMSGKDPLCKGKEFIFKPYKHVQDPDTIKRIKEGARISVPKRIRWRKEDEFHLLNIRWANTIEVEDDVAEFLQRYQNSKKTFTVKDFGESRVGELANLIYKDAVISEDIPVDIRKSGVSIDPAKLPKT
jgi:radical SAM protein with 4Fe4S-binding SPASM domain